MLISKNTRMCAHQIASFGDRLWTWDFQNLTTNPIPYWLIFFTIFFYENAISITETKGLYYMK